MTQTTIEKLICDIDAQVDEIGRINFEEVRRILRSALEEARHEGYLSAVEIEERANAR